MSRRLSLAIVTVVTLALAACTNPVAPDSNVSQQTSGDIVVQGSGG